MTHDRIVSVIGLGYVGLPVAVAFGQKAYTVGFDINVNRLNELVKGVDSTNEVSVNELQSSNIKYTNDLVDLRKANFHIIAVPTPINNAKQPDLTPLLKASETVGKALKKGDIVVYESTVYPGATEEDCVPVLEYYSKLKCGVDFKVGYSPERINPGDKQHTFTKIKKIVSGQDQEVLDIISDVYESVIVAGVYKASSIKVAEAAKVIENSQRDINIAFVNELAMIFDLMGINTREVLEAAGTKWNFLSFTPGLVGGHCIGVDPYYLTHKAEKLGYHPQVILAGRRINDGVGKYIAERTVKEMIHSGKHILNSKVTVLGVTFKENCPDLRNSKVVDIIRELEQFGVEVQVHDGLADPKEALDNFNVHLSSFEKLERADALIVAVAHDAYKQLTAEQLKQFLKEDGALIDVKGIVDGSWCREGGIRLWKL